jgi:murein DD-endopeptidase MepM/ murein hydrolase activator NlpD
MSRISVKEGDRVRKGDVVGKAGNTGTSTGIHLHFEILKDGKHVNPLSYVRFK